MEWTVFTMKRHQYIKYYRKCLGRILLLSLVGAALITGVWAAACQQDQQALAGKMIRLHVIANSDEKADQDLKLQVRDAILEKAETILQKAEDRQEAETQLRAALPELEQAAKDTMEQAGYGYSAAATLSWEWYPTRYYETFTLPAGKYLSLRLVLGEGEGRNWWCVVFPPLCTAASVRELDPETTGLTESETEMITEASGEYEVRFKTLELLSSLFRRLGF